MKKRLHRPERKSDADPHEILGAYRTLALADRHTIDPVQKTARPSDSQVEEMRNWSRENKL